MVVDLGVLPGFVAVILLFLIPPGPDMAYMLAVGLEAGRRAAVRAILGIATGMCVYAAAVVVGVGKLAREHPLVLDAVKLLGALYLLWLAFTTIRAARRSSARVAGATTGRPYLRGATVSLTNPKVLLFFLAVLPQFIGAAREPLLQLAVLGAVTVLMELLLYGTVGVLAGVLNTRLQDSRRTTTALHYLAAGVYLALAIVVTVEIIAALPTR